MPQPPVSEFRCVIRADFISADYTLLHRATIRPASASTLAYCALVSRRIVSAFAWACWRPNDYLVDQGLSQEWSGAPIMNPINGITITPDGHEVWQAWM